MKKATMKNQFVYMAASLVLVSLAQAKDLKTDHMSARDMLKARLDATLSVLRDANLEPEEKNKRIEEIVTPMFDFTLMAKYTLGKKHWLALTKSQQDQFVLLFVRHLKNSYRDKITLYTDQKIVFERSTLKDKMKAVVPTELVSEDDSAVSVVYRLRKQKDIPWKVYDIEIEEISLVMTYRAQFQEILQKGTIDKLMAQLAKSLEESTPRQ